MLDKTESPDAQPALGHPIGAVEAEQRAAQYRQFAANAVSKAKTATDGDCRAEYFSMASGWIAMATEMERIGRLAGKRDRKPSASP